MLLRPLGSYSKDVFFCYLNSQLTCFLLFFLQPFFLIFLLHHSSFVRPAVCVFLRIKPPWSRFSLFVLFFTVYFVLVFCWPGFFCVVLAYPVLCLAIHTNGLTSTSFALDYFLFF